MLLLRIQTFLKSLWFHVYNGFPKSTKAEIEYRYNICINCEYYNDKFSMCDYCGCNLSKKSKFLNKLAWADQKCPIDKWMPTHGAKQ